MTTLIALVPLVVAPLGSWLLYRLNRRRRWFTIGEMIFWAVILLVISQLVWLIWF